MSSRDFNQDTSRAKKAASNGPVYITDRGRPAHVLLTYEAYQELIGTHDLVDRLGSPPGVEDIELSVPVFDDSPRPAELD